MLNITKEEFREIYAGLKILDNIDLFYTEPENDVQLAQEYLPSKLWRLNNIYTIVNKWGKPILFRMNKSQHRVYAAALRHPRVIILKSRQQGISTLWLVSFFDDAVTMKSFSIGLMAQGSDEAATLLERTKILWERLHDGYKKQFRVAATKDNTKEFSFSNGSQIFIRTSFRSATLQRLHISEMGKIANNSPKKAKETKTGTLQALAQGNIGIVESTAEGDNLFKSMWDSAVLLGTDNLTPKDFLPVFLSWLDDPDCVIERDQIINDHAAKYFTKLEKEIGYKLTRQQKNFWVTQYRELGDEVYQEYPSTAMEAFMATREGAYYAKLYLRHVINNKRIMPQNTLYDPRLDVQLAVDLGMDDTMVLGPFQTHRKETRIIGEFADNGQDIEYYCDWIKEQIWFVNLTRIILPHDGEVTELTSGMTRKEKFEEQLPGIDIIVLPKTGVQEGIQMVRQMVKNLFIDEACEYIKKCFINYSKDWDEKREVWRKKPNHDEYSNGADMLRYMAMGAEHKSTFTLPTKENDFGQTSSKSRRLKGVDV